MRVFLFFYLCFSLLPFTRWFAAPALAGLAAFLLRPLHFPGLLSLDKPTLDFDQTKKGTAARLCSSFLAFVARATPLYVTGSGAGSIGSAGA